MSFEEVQQIARSLGEHFDAVQILVSFIENGTTEIWKPGCGNWYTRKGMAHEFIESDLARDNAKEIAKELNPED